MANRQFVVYQLKKTDDPVYRIGLSVSKKLGHAVTRNRLKRQIRHVLYELQPCLAPGRDYIIIARKPVVSMDFHEMKKSLIHVLRRARALEKCERKETKR